MDKERQNLTSWLSRKLGLTSPEAEYKSRMKKLGKGKSREAIQHAINIYLLSNKNPRETDSHFERNIKLMAEAIAEDQIVPHQTEDLGLSQTIRLWRFFKKIQSEGVDVPKTFPSPDISEHQETFSQFPTVGAEFHIPNHPDNLHPNFWRRLAILNMSQHQKGSSVPFSKEEQGLIEIRLNPSIYPVAIATWNHMRLLLPELNQNYFTITMNWKNTNFSKKDHIPLVTSLQTLGNLSYAAFFKNVPPVERPNELDFGDWYIGQTVKVKNGRYDTPGGIYYGTGQLNLYSGYGEIFPHLSYYLSMAMVEPELTKLTGDRTITATQAVDTKEEYIRNIFERINDIIVRDPKLYQATQTGERIISQLNP